MRKPLEFKAGFSGVWETTCDCCELVRGFCLNELGLFIEVCTENVLLSLKPGVPSSVTTTLMRLVLGA